MVVVRFRCLKLQVPGLCKEGTGPEGYGYLGGQLVCDKDDIYGHWSPKGRTAGWMVLCREAAPEGKTMWWSVEAQED